MEAMPCLSFALLCSGCPSSPFILGLPLDFLCFLFLSLFPVACHISSRERTILSFLFHDLFFCLSVCFFFWIFNIFLLFAFPLSLICIASMVGRVSYTALHGLLFIPNCKVVCLCHGFATL